MRTVYKMTFGVMCSVFLLLFGTMNSFCAKALDNGIYTATCTPYYVHPVTGVVEDSGGIESEGIGQPMTDSATCTTALIEVDSDGNTYATVRLSLMDNIENVSFMVQSDGNSPFYDVSYDIMQEDLDNNTTDFRMQVPSENCYLRATFYVVPMGRDVIYYIGFSNLQPGSSDFITSIDIVDQQQEEIQQTEATQATSELASTTVSTTEITTTSTTTTTTLVETTTVITDAEGYMPQTGDYSDADGSGILIYDENGNLMQLSDLVDGSVDTTEKDDNSNSNAIVIGILVGCGGTVVVIGIAYAIIRAKRKKASQ